MKTTRFRCFVSGLLLLGLLTGGCSTIRGSRPVNVTASDPICKKSVEVHLVGVNEIDKPKWETESMTDYWTPGNTLRKTAKDNTYVIQFGRGPCTVTLDKKDPILRRWKSRKVKYLFVLADLPGVFTDKDGNADARRLQLPATNSKRWGWREKQIDIEINEDGIGALTVPKPD